ncbi:hypothetical protein AAT19DRAFT_14784 [Rhodotorula toruloides]|uniref:Uncharacterized protein n=1 Tax=Rhodotorula toruloides TaxID=5286 RepID=A0A2T0A8T9_RHOTO|nr:hypothetical protein AAT19DRAFT_14784 [Rhodotorula toruloides]
MASQKYLIGIVPAQTFRLGSANASNCAALVLFAFYLVFVAEVLQAVMGRPNPLFKHEVRTTADAWSLVRWQWTYELVMTIFGSEWTATRVSVRELTRPAYRSPSYEPAQAALQTRTAQVAPRRSPHHRRVRATFLSFSPLHRRHL